ncbi:antibiotic biosynthesis monooxygenase [Amycolatopsis samaneae]|uniref:Antibiotic biosynthesis monooxygenase n=1 Tax=Amycolatopsis samaneae TaxID=664691 RepID=A0ABW5GQ00_9PSEU
MTFRTKSLTNPARADVDAPTFGFWRVGTRERQHAAIEALADAWEARPWPASALRTYSVFAGSDGTTLLHYSQWADEDAHRVFTRTGRDPRNEEVFAAVPGIERLGSTSYRLHRSRVDDPATTAGCVVIVLRRFDKPDPDRARQLIDTLFSVPAHTPTPGLLSAHFHVSTDGSRVLNYAEWTSENAHRAAVADRPQEIDDNAEWRKAHSWPGLTSTTVQYFRPALTFVSRDTA